MSGGGADETRLNRLTALSDGIFAIAMTLLVLDIQVTAGLDTAGFHSMVRGLFSHVGAYALSFTIIAGVWRDHHRILGLARGLDALSGRLVLMGLGVIALLPFPTTLLSEYASQPLSVAVYACTIIVIDLLQLALLLSIRRAPGTARPDVRRTGRNIAADLGSTALVFGATVPVAFLVSPAAALWCWLVLIPLKVALGRHEALRALTRTFE
ncbi:TMEM175 family protein [Streptomyces sp. NPDC059134]|uniref:TMEM175 family protein n=1 Tax=Streptomyces sp. NPDC059134 TaxID=3346738 RepID=UPI00369FC0D5